MKRLILAGILMTLPHNSHTQSPQASEAEVNMGIAGEMFSHQDWTDLLQAHVRADEDGVNRFDYSGLKENQNDRDKLDGYITRLTKTDISALPDTERFAALANLYNALTIRLIVENYPIKSITNIRPSLFAIGPWKKDIVELEGVTVSLDDIEHKMLRPQFNDPRVHYAVNCASYGCPNIPLRAWSADTLGSDLDLAARDYINHPRGVSIRSDGRLKVSTIYRWYREDFGGSEKGVIDHLLQYAEPALAEQIRTNPDIADHGYNWSLNDTRSGE